LPSVPTSRADAADLGRERAQLVDHRVDGLLELQDLARTSTVIFLEKVAVGHRDRHLGDVATWPVRLLAMELTLSVRSFHVPATPSTRPGRRACPPCRPSRATRLTSPANGVELVHHRVDGVLEREDLALDLDRDLRGEVAVRHGGGHVGDVAHLRGQVRRPSR
jgi:hypothetical protein